MILRIIFLGMLSIPFLYLFLTLTGYLADDIVTQNEKSQESQSEGLREEM